jgi:hypothetical protein
MVWCRTTATGQSARCTTAWLTEPRRRPATFPRPCDPDHHGALGAVGAANDDDRAPAACRQPDGDRAGEQAVHTAVASVADRHQLGRPRLLEQMRDRVVGRDVLLDGESRDLIGGRARGRGELLVGQLPQRVPHHRTRDDDAAGELGDERGERPDEEEGHVPPLRLAGSPPHGPQRRLRPIDTDHHRPSGTSSIHLVLLVDPGTSVAARLRSRQRPSSRRGRSSDPVSVRAS